MRGGICGQISLRKERSQQKCRIVHRRIRDFSYDRLHRICRYYGSHSLMCWIYYVRDHVKKPGLYVGGNMVQCVTRLWRLVSGNRIRRYYRRMRIPSEGGFLLEIPTFGSLGTFQIGTQLSHKHRLILTILTVVHTSGSVDY